MNKIDQIDAGDAVEFDPRSGSFVEQIIFNYRKTILLVCVALTCILGWESSKLIVNASYSQMLPEYQKYVVNYESNRDAIRALGDSIRIVVENKKGDIYSRHYLSSLRKINNKIFLLPDVDRSFMKSIWTPSVRWTQITAQGAVGGPVMPGDYNGSTKSINRLRRNILQAGIIGSLVSNDQKSSEIFVPLLERDPATRKPFDYGQFWSSLQSVIRQFQSPSIKIRVIGFAAVIGYLIAALHKIFIFFFIALIIIASFVLWFTECVRSTVTIVICSTVAVVWLLGIIRMFGYVLDPYSILVPFLIFAIGVSHGAQKMNGIMQDVGHGAHSYVAARLTFRRLFVTGLTALVADAVGFAVLNVISIQAIRTLAITASIGVVVLIFTNLIILPILLSYIGISKSAATRSLEKQKTSKSQKIVAVIFRFLERFCGRRWAALAIIATTVLVIMGYGIGRNLQIGDVSAGAPELRRNSTYNRDNAYVMSHYNLSNDQFAVIVKTTPNGLDNFYSILEIDRLEQRLRKIHGVQTTTSIADLVRKYTMASFDGDIKWWTINRNVDVIGEAISTVLANNPNMINTNSSVAPVIAYLHDHRARTLTAVTKVVKRFAKKHNTTHLKFLLAAGTAGMAEATNIVVGRANLVIPYIIYGAVAILCFVAFRNVLAVVVAIVPLIVTTILCRALMVLLGIGVKVATLPVVALGIGIGVDYALYLLSVQLRHQRDGDSLEVAYRKALHFTGRIVILVGFTLAVAVSLWAFSPIRFQADMGILLSFMFLWNMLGSLILIPSLSHFFLKTEWLRKSRSEVVDPPFQLGDTPEKSDR